jgi:hypothetical protein
LGYPAGKTKPARSPVAGRRISSAVEQRFCNSAYQFYSATPHIEKPAFTGIFAASFRALLLCGTWRNTRLGPKLGPREDTGDETLAELSAPTYLANALQPICWLSVSVGSTLHRSRNRPHSPRLLPFDAMVFYAFR